MRYEKPQAEVMKFDFETFMSGSASIICTSVDTPIGSFTCSDYQQGQSCRNVTWTSTGYSCGVFSSGNCQSVYSPPGSMGDGCHAWKLTCTNF